MASQDAQDFFDKQASQSYDERNANLGAITDNLHLLIRLILQDLPADARILCVGVGTGTEILHLAQHFPYWHFTGVDPSASMLDVCKDKLEDADLLSRCELVEGYIEDVPVDRQFDAVLCLLVTHFIKDTDKRQNTFDSMYALLKPGGYLINADISYDTASPLYDDMFAKWQNLQKQRGATEESLSELKTMMIAHLSVLPAPAMEKFLKTAGFPTPIQFFQSLLISGWYSQKPS
ncbi:MAG: class I SAM-dependent methyltransferase [Alphaproteobacteria bacterium]|nr:class I SAM-dependent methyltransferase [Alphaproteobacteria bacterium]